MTKDQAFEGLSPEFAGNFDLDSLADQLRSVLVSKDPIGYMERNINWEIDADVDDADLLSLDMPYDESFVLLDDGNPLRRFYNWLRRSRLSKKVKRILCGIADQIKELLDEEAELKKLLTVAIAAIAAALGAGAINPVLLTLLVGFLASMILKGVAQFCAG